jgi:LDH2 family malate/lactate/ureidoglycolate dehydrogenase
MATSAISFGALLKAQALHESIPENVAIDRDGNPTTDPTRAMEGATLAFDKSYKGSGLAMMVEILSGVWPGADFVGKNPDGAWGNTFMAFSPALLSDLDEFKRRMTVLVETVRNSKTKDGHKIRIPGEHTLLVRDQSLDRGTVEVDEELFAALKT